MKTQTSFRRANIREKYLERQNIARSKLIPGSLIHTIINGKDKKPLERKKFYVQNAESYVNLLKKNYEYYGIPFKHPNVEEMPPYEKNETKIEHRIEHLDQIKVCFTVLKSGKVRVKILPQMAILNEKYYSKGNIPPIKSVTSALKTLGYSQDFVETVSKKYTERKKLIEQKWKILEKRFDAPSAVSLSKKKRMEKKTIEDEEVVEDDNDEDEEKDENEPEENESIEIDDEDGDEEVVEEEYISDGGED
jgi:hypothetical protein